MVKPGGTGRPRLAISARLAPLPPSRSRNVALPSALPSPNVNTHLPDLTASAAGLGTTIFLTAFAAGFAATLVDSLARLFFSPLRAVAGGAALARAGADDFDFAAIFSGVFLDFATALAMTDNNPIKGIEMGALHHFGRFRASRETPAFW